MIFSDTASAPVTSHDGVTEKNHVGNDEIREVNSGRSLEADEVESTHKQEGVRQVEAIITVWSKQLLITMFIL